MTPNYPVVEKIKVFFVVNFVSLLLTGAILIGYAVS